MSGEKFGVLLMAFGGPDRPEAIEPFVTQLLGGRKLPPPAMEKIKERYRLIGGRSPLVDITRRQTEALQKKLGTAIPVAMGMCYASPSIFAGLQQLLAEEVTTVIALSLSPHYSRVSTGAYQKKVEQAAAELGERVRITFAPGWYDHPLAIEAYSKRIKAALEKLPGDAADEVELLFSAHSLPVSYIEAGEPYVQEIMATVAGISKNFPGYSWQLAYQSRGGGRGEWLGPQVEEVLQGYAKTRRCSVLLAPLSFAADHVETLYDIDIEIKRHADELGINLRRAEALNTQERFIEALAHTVQETIHQSRE